MEFGGRVSYFEFAYSHITILTERADLFKRPPHSIYTTSAAGFHGAGGRSHGLFALRGAIGDVGGGCSGRAQGLYLRERLAHSQSIQVAQRI